MLWAISIAMLHRRRRPDGGRTRSRARAGSSRRSRRRSVPASGASSRRQLAGFRPDCEIARTAPAAARKSSNSTPQETLYSGRGRTRTQASAITPRMPSEPISIRSGRGTGAGARQPPALPGAARGDRPHRLDQVVDVGVEGGEVAAGPGRDPAAQGRVLEGLREVAQGEAVLAQLLLEPRPGGAGLDPRRERESASTSSTRSRRRRSSETTGRSPSRRLDAADDAGAAAEGIDRGALGLGPAEHRLDLRLVARKRDEVGRVLELAPEAAHHVAVGLAERVDDALVAIVAEEIAEPAGAFSRGARSSTSSSGTGSSASPPNPSRSLIPRRGLPPAASATVLVLVAPSPSASCAARLIEAARSVAQCGAPLCRTLRARRSRGLRRGTSAPPTSARLSSGGRRRAPRWSAPCRAPPRPCPSRPATPGRARRRC